MGILMKNALIETNDDEFDEIFFSKHGVGDNPVSEDAKLMASLDNTNPTYQECEFVRMFFREGNITDAYIRAFGFTGNEHRRDYFTKLANRLIKRPRVLKKLNEYRAKAQALADEDVATLIHELNEDRKAARQAGQISAAITAVKTKAQILGLEKSSVGTMNVVLDLTDDQKRNLLGRISKRLSHDKSNAEIIDAEFEDVEQRTD